MSHRIVTTDMSPRRPRKAWGGKRSPWRASNRVRPGRYGRLVDACPCCPEAELHDDGRAVVHRSFCRWWLR